ncbi:MAG: Methyltransferase gidB [Pseudomonadota bacterium]|jgi:16S rRNA (guanine527-N7)-methyltransferase
MNLYDLDSLRASLRAGADALSLDLPDPQLEQLLAYLALLHKWNRVYNLTAVRDPKQMLTQHLLDCMAALPVFEGAQHVLDVGAGGGLPGIVIAIWARHAQPQMRVEMIDTVHKKTAFLTQVKAELGLANVKVNTGRVEQFEPAEKFDVITSRAFADLGDFVRWSGHVLQAGGRMLALKGQAETTQREVLPEGWHIVRDIRLQVPGMDAERHVLQVERSTV